MANVCCRAVCGLSTCAILGRGGHGRIRRQSDSTWVCWWRQVTEEEVHLCRAAAAGRPLLFYFYCLGDVGEAARRCSFSLAGDRPGTLGADRHCRWKEVLCCGCCFVDGGVVLGGGCKRSGTRRTPFPLPVAAGLQWKGKRGQTDCIGGKLQDPGMGLSSG
jgi:hypothetical protein